MKYVKKYKRKKVVFEKKLKSGNWKFKLYLDVNTTWEKCQIFMSDLE